MARLELLHNDSWDEALLQHAVRAELQRRSHASREVPRTHAALASGPAALHADMRQQLDAVHALFGRWEQEAEAHRAAARRARPFSSAAELQAALVVFNARGQRTSRQGTIILQDFFFAPRRRPSRLEAAPCHRCCIAIQRQQLYYVDVAKPPRQANEVCEPCMTALLRQALGQDDAAIMEEAAALLERAWTPRIDVALADELLPRRTHFS